jgi:hypothetical protein
MGHIIRLVRVRLAFPKKENLVMPHSLFPRRYYIDDEGRRVLIGLTVEQTREFELFEAPDSSFEIQIGISASSDPTQSNHRKRWLELYLLHQDAWEIWRSKSSEADLSKATTRRPPLSYQELI